MVATMDGVSSVKRAMEVFSKKVYAELPIQQILLFLEVAEHEGITMKELTNLTKMPQSCVSKNVRQLSQWLRPKKDNPTVKEIAGHDLVNLERDLENPRTFALKLTKKGKEIVKQISK